MTSLSRWSVLVLVLATTILHALPQTVIATGNTNSILESVNEYESTTYYYTITSIAITYGVGTMTNGYYGQYCDYTTSFVIYLPYPFSSTTTTVDAGFTISYSPSWDTPCYYAKAAAIDAKSGDTIVWQYDENELSGTGTVTNTVVLSLSPNVAIITIKAQEVLTPNSATSAMGGIPAPLLLALGGALLAGKLGKRKHQAQ